MFTIHNIQPSHSLNSQQYLSTVVKVLLGALDKAESVDVADVTLAVGSQQIKSADRLLRERKGQTRDRK